MGGSARSMRVVGTFQIETLLEVSTVSEPMIGYDYVQDRLLELAKISACHATDRPVRGWVATC